MSTWQQGARATFTFKGTSVRVVGAVHNKFFPRTFRASYELDGGTPAYTEHTSTARAAWGVEFFSAAGLRDSAHTLLVTYLSPATIDLEIDYIEYWDTTGEPQAPVPPPGTSTTATPETPQPPPPPTASSSTSRGAVSAPTTTATGDEDVGKESADEEVGGTVEKMSTGAGATVKVEAVTTTDAAGHATVVSQTQYLINGRTYTRDPGLAATAGLDNDADDGTDAAAGAQEGDGSAVPVGALVGGILGALLFCIVIATLILLRRRRARRRNRASHAYVFTQSDAGASELSAMAYSTAPIPATSTVQSSGYTSEEPPRQTWPPPPYYEWESINSSVVGQAGSTCDAAPRGDTTKLRG